MTAPPVPAPRSGLLGSWDRFVGPGASTAENLGTVGLGVAGAVLAPRLSRTRLTTGGRLALRLVAADLWGGAWCNNTATCAAWYERPGQGTREHLVFAALHLHPFLFAWLDRSSGTGGRRRVVNDRVDERGPEGSTDRRVRGWAWGCGHYGYLLAATAGMRMVPVRHRAVASVAATAGALALDAAIGRSRSAPWFGTVFAVKLLLGHASGAAATGSSTAAPAR